MGGGGGGGGGGPTLLELRNTRRDVGFKIFSNFNYESVINPKQKPLKVNQNFSETSTNN